MILAHLQGAICFPLDPGVSSAAADSTPGYYLSSLRDDLRLDKVSGKNAQPTGKAVIPGRPMTLSELQSSLRDEDGETWEFMCKGCETVSYTHLTLPTNREV